MLQKSRFDGFTIVDNQLQGRIKETFTIMKLIQNLFIQGWGSSSFGGEKSQILMQVKMPIVEYNTCAQANKDLGEVVDTMMVCAGYGGDSKLSGCHGDSGGPLVCQDETGRWTLRGTVSWGDHYCSGGPTYSVFVRINSYIDWIKCKMTSQPVQPRKFIKNTRRFCGLVHANYCLQTIIYDSLKKKPFCGIHNSFRSFRGNGHRTYISDA